MTRSKPVLSLVSILFALGFLVHAGGSRAAIVPPGGKLDFSVMRDGEKIGTHVLSFRRDNDRLDVDVHTRIAVKIAFITVYRFEHDGHEVWRDGRLVEMRTKTNDDGADHMLQVSADRAGKLRVVGDGRETEEAADAIPASLWNPAFMRTKSLFDSLDGTPIDFSIADKGREDVTVKGRTVRARHYSMTGDLPRELWYDDDGRLVRMTLTGKDGSAVQYELD